MKKDDAIQAVKHKNSLAMLTSIARWPKKLRFRFIVEQESPILLVKKINENGGWKYLIDTEPGLGKGLVQRLYEVLKEAGYQVLSP